MLSQGCLSSHISAEVFADGAPMVGENEWDVAPAAPTQASRAVVPLLTAMNETHRRHHFLFLRRVLCDQLLIKHQPSTLPHCPHQEMGVGISRVTNWLMVMGVFGPNYSD